MRLVVLRAIIALSIVALAMAASADEAKTKPEGKEGKDSKVAKYDAKTFYDTTAYFGASFSCDEKRLLITSDASGVFNAYSIPVEGGEPKQLTDSKSSAIIAVSYFPNDDRILYTQDEGGNELNHIYVRETDGKIKDLTPGKGLKATFGGWSHDFKHFYVLTNERDPKFFDCYRHDTDGYARTLLFKNTDGFGQILVSGDGRRVALVKTRTNADNDIYLWDATTPETAPKKITEHKGDVQHSVNTFSPTSDVLYYGSDKDSEFNRCWAYYLRSGVHKVEVEDKWDVMGVGFSWHGRYRTSSVNDDGRTATTVFDTKSGKVVPFPKFASANVTGVGFSKSEGTAAFYVNGDTAPSDLFVLDIATGKHKKLTSSLNPKVRQEDLVDSKVVRYPGIDKLPIPALLYRPHGSSAQSKAPAMVYCHGGPGGQCRVGYDPVIQYLVNHGYAVLAVNNRGSSGYGKTFFHMDDRKHGDVDLKDVVSGRRYLETLDWINGGKVGVIGGSYGGYLVCAALAFDPDAFDVGVDIFGVTNWVRTLESIPPWWAAFRDSLYAELGDPKTDRDRLKSISPLFHAKNIKKPLLVVQGANDPRVLQVESDEIVKEVRANNVPVEYLVFKDEGHGFRKKDNRIQAAEAYRKFLDKYLVAGSR